LTHDAPGIHYEPKAVSPDATFRLVEGRAAFTPRSDACRQVRPVWIAGRYNYAMKLLAYTLINLREFCGT